MTHTIHRVESFEIVAAHTLRVRFDDGTEQTIHLWPILVGELYGPLRDPEMFGRVRVDPEVTPWCGPTERTSIRPPCTTGPATSRLSENSPGAGSLRGIEGIAAARKLEFEKAAQLRDRVKELKMGAG